MFNENQPAILPAVSRIICIGDVHGDLKRVAELLQVIGIIDANTQWIAEPKNTVVIQLGDQVDSMTRGTNKEWETMPDTEVVRFMDHLDRIARRSGGRVLSMIGNHELMNVMGDYSYVSPKSMVWSGGVEKREEMFRNGGSMAQQLSKRNVITRIGNVTFCHGGLLPQHLNSVGDNTAILNDVTRRFLQGERLQPQDIALFHTSVMGMEGIIWTRRYFELLSAGNQAELERIVQEVLQRTGTRYIVVGHSTVSQITPAANGALWFVDAALSRAYDSTYNEVLEILYDDDPTRSTEFRVMRIQKEP